jgi:hypothetical protein
MKYFIRANVFGKMKYWEQINGLHSGKSKLAGYDIFDTIQLARDKIQDLQKVFHNGIVFEALPDHEIPFIKRQNKLRLKIK